jgi:protocatechuate 3,4-dioxygenase beta subunit
LPYQFSKVIWHSATVAPESGRWKRLYRVTLPNPQPDRAVAGVELVGAGDEPTLMVLAATLDPLALGARPDDSPDLEPTDTTPPNYVQVLVVDRREAPIAGAQLRMQAFPVSVASPPSTRYLTTDANGAVAVAYPPSAQRRLDLSVSHENYGARKMSWEIKGRDEVPATFKFKLEEAITIGGVVVNRNSEPVPDAKLAFWRYWSGGERPDTKGEQPDFSNRTVTTDSSGRWQLKSVPPGLLANIGFRLTHADYPTTNMTFRGDEESQLRAGTFKLVLDAGISVTGRVLDESDSPIGNATVWSGRRFMANRQKTTTDNAGRFKLGSVEEGPVLFSFSADGYAADSKTIAVRPGMDEVIVRLKPGHSIRGIVQDESGQPVSGVRVVLEDNRQPTSDEAFEFTATTGDDGRFEWKSAPNERKAFYIGKQGYEQMRNKLLEVDTDNLVTLRKPRQVEGYVLDADTSQPITKFQVAAGRSYAAGSFYPDGGRQAKQQSDANGHFTIELDDQDQTAIRVEATDYASQVKTVAAESRTSQLEFRLKPSAALKGIVVSQEGQPQPGVQVAIARGGTPGSMGNNLSLRQGKLQKFGDDSRVVTTDENGAFSLDSPPETGGKVVAAGNNGYGSASVDEVRASGRLFLQDYGQIEGTLRIGGAPAPGQDYYFTMSRSGINTDFTGFKATTDSDGRFKLTKLPAGEGEVVRLVQSSPRSWTHSYSTNVTVIAGQTIYLSLGDSGALLKGTARMQVPATDGEVLYLSGSLHSARTAPRTFSSPEESRAFMQSAEWQAEIKARKNFAVAVGADGAFTIDSVPPGSYKLDINASRPSSGSPMSSPVASGSIDVTVPDYADPFNPIQVGEVVLIGVTNRMRYPGQ